MKWCKVLGSDLGAFVFFVSVCLITCTASGVITATSVNSWYQQLRKPGFTPPDWVFAPIWTVLFIGMGIACWRVWRAKAHNLRQAALFFFTVQLVLNVTWSIFFFGLRKIDWALIEIVMLLFVIIICTFLFWKVDQLAGLLFIPYVAWVSYAMILNASICSLNCL